MPKFDVKELKYYLEAIDKANNLKFRNLVDQETYDAALALLRNELKVYMLSVLEEKSEPEPAPVSKAEKSGTGANRKPSK